MKRLSVQRSLLGLGCKVFTEPSWRTTGLQRHGEDRDGVSSNVSLKAPGTFPAEHAGVDLGFVFLKDAA